MVTCLKVEKGGIWMKDRAWVEIATRRDGDEVGRNKRKFGKNKSQKSRGKRGRGDNAPRIKYFT
jgi:hypothetical protein